MSNLADIEAAIQELPEQQVEQLSRWLETLHARKASQCRIDSWLEQARGTALPGVSTDSIMSVTRGDQ